MPLPFEKWGSDRRNRGRYSTTLEWTISTKMLQSVYRPEVELPDIDKVNNILVIGLNISCNIECEKVEKKNDRDGKDDGRKDKKKKSKMKSKEEEMLEREVSLLKFQLVEERQNTRREKLNSLQLLKELADTKRNFAMKETLAQALYKKEQEQRVRAEQRLSTVLTDNEGYKTQLDHLRNTLTEQGQQQNGSPEAGPNNNGEIELTDTEDKAITELQQEKTLLLERLRIIESNNSALVLEGEKQQQMYERCLDEVATQVVQALLIQRELKEECTKLRNRVEELEIHNRQLRHLFEQEVWLKKQSHEGCILENGGSPSSTPGCSVHARHHHSGSPAVFRHTYFSQTEMHHLPPHLYQSHLRGSPRVPPYPGAVSRQSSLPSMCFSNCLPSAYVSDHVARSGGISQGHITSPHMSLPSSFGRSEFPGGGECFRGGDDTLNDLTNFGPSDYSGNQCVGNLGEVNGIVRKTQSLPATPLAQRSSTHPQSYLRNQTTFEFTENHNYLCDIYTKPYIHAPLDYAQSLLRELRELGASFKSFESLTLEPRSINPPQKRKGLGDLESNPQPQKLVKGHDYLHGNYLSGTLENSDTFSLEDFPPDGAGSYTSGESIETAYERIIPSPEMSPQRNKNIVPKLVLEESSLIVQGDVLFDLDEQLLENDNFDIDLPDSFEDFAKGMKSGEMLKNTESMNELCIVSRGDDSEVEKEDTLEKQNIEKEKGGNKSCDTSDEKNVALAGSTKVEEGELVAVLAERKSSPTRGDTLDDSGADYCRSIIPNPEHTGFEDIEAKRTDPQWKIEAEKYQDRPPTLPPRTRLASASLELGSDEVFLASGGAEAKKRNDVTPPALPPKPLWMRIGNINLSTEEPPPVPERKPFELEGQECLSWKWRKSYDTSDIDVSVSNSPMPLWEEARKKAKETDVELCNLLSSESETEEEGLDYLAMWKAREKTPSWKGCLDTTGAVSVKNISETQARLSAVAKNDDHPRNSQSDVIGCRESTEVKPAADDLETPKVRARKESLIKKPSVQKPEQKKKSSIPLFRSKKDKSASGREKSMVKDFVSSIKAVMDGSRSSSPLRKSLRSKSPKPKESGKKGKGDSSKNSSRASSQNREEEASQLRDSKGADSPVSDPVVTGKGKGKPPLASSKRSLIPKGNHKSRKSPRQSSCSQSSELSSGQPSAKTESKGKLDRRSKIPSSGKEVEAESKVRVSKGNNCALDKGISSGNFDSRNIEKEVSPRRRSKFLRVSSKGSLIFDEPNPSKSVQCVGGSLLGSIDSFHRVPFIDGNTPEGDIMVLSDEFARLSSGSIGQASLLPSRTEASSYTSESIAASADSHSRKYPNHASNFMVGRRTLQGDQTDRNVHSGQDFSSSFVDQKEVDDIKKGKLVRDFDMANYNMNVLSSRSACTLPPMGKNFSDPWARSNIKSMSQGHTPPDGLGKTTQSDSVLQGAQGPDRLIHVPLVNGEIFDSCDESMDENGSMEHGGENKAQLSEKERANLLDSLFDTDSDDDGSCSQDASELASYDGHPEDKGIMGVLDERGDAKIHAVRQGAHNRVSLMQVDICSMFTRFGEKERQALSSFDFLEKVLSVQEGDHPFLSDELSNGIKRPDSGFAGYTSDSQPSVHLSDISRPFTGDPHRADGQVSPFAANNEQTNTSMSSSLSTGSLSS